MKSKQRLLFVIFSMAFLAGNANAQFFKARLLPGFTFSQIDGDHIAGYNKVGINAGIGVYHELNPQSSVGFEIAFAQKGSRLVNDPDAAIQPIFIIKSSYIEFPLVYEFRIKSIDAIYVHTGLSVGANIGGTIDDGFRVDQANFNAIEAAFLLGAAYRFNDKFAFKVRHGYSINRIGLNFPNSRRIFNRVGMYNRLFTIGVEFLLNPK